MKKIRTTFFCVLWALASCQTTAPENTEIATDATAAADDSTATETQRFSPLRVDVRGIITQREYRQGQLLILVEGVADQNSRFTRAVVLVTPITRIKGIDGKSISLHELFNGQQVAVQFRGRFQESISGFAAQATAREIWIEPLNE